MKKILLMTAAAIIGSISDAASQHRIYFSDQVFTPGLTRQGQFRLGISAIPQLKTPHLNYQDFFKTTFCTALQVGYAATDHLGLFASYRVRGKKLPEQFTDVDLDYTYPYDLKSGYYKGNSMEVAAGYFTRLGKYAMVEGYSGYSYGSIRTFDFEKKDALGARDYNYSTSYHRFFLQATAGLQNDYFSFRAGFRFIVQRYVNFSAQDSTIDVFKDHHSAFAESSYTEDGAGVMNQSFGFIQPFVHLEAGGKMLKLNFQGGFSSQIGGDRIHRNANVDPYASVGISFQLNSIRSL